MATRTVSPLAWPVPQIASLPQISEKACGEVVPETEQVPHTVPVPQTASRESAKTEVPHTATVPQIARVPEREPVPQTANVPEFVPQTASCAFGATDTVLAAALYTAVGESAAPLNTSLFARAAGMLRYPAPMVKMSNSSV